MRIFLYVALSVSCASPLPNSAVCRQIECEVEEKKYGCNSCKQNTNEMEDEER